MRCSSSEPQLDAYLEGALSHRQARAIAAHLRGCASCTALLHELRVVDALLNTTRPPKVAADFAASVVSAAPVSHPKSTRRMPLVVAFLLFYVGVAWGLAALAALRRHELAGLATQLAGAWQRDLAALGAAGRALAPATPLAAATVTGVLLLDLLLLAAIFYAYRRLRPILAVYLAQGPRR